MSSDRLSVLRTGYGRFAPQTVLLAVAVLVPVVLAEVQLLSLARAAAFIVALLSLNLLLGYTGQISLGHAAFIGTGSFVAIQIGGRGLPLPLAILGAGVAVAALTAIVGLPSLRIRGLAVAIATLVYGLAAKDYLFEQPWFTGSDKGLSMPAVIGHASAYRMWLVALTVLVLVVLLDRQLLRTKLGRAFVTVREAEERAVAFGVQPGPVKLRAYAMSGFLAGLSGGLLAAITGIVSGSDFTVLESLELLAITVVGGAGSRLGVIAAGALLVGFPLLVPPPDERLAPLIGGIVLVATILFLPRGLGGIIDKLRGLRFKVAVAVAGVAAVPAILAANAARGVELADTCGVDVSADPFASPCWNSGWLPVALLTIVVAVIVALVFGREPAVDGNVEDAIGRDDDTAERAKEAAANATVVRQVPRSLGLRMPARVMFEARDVSVRFGGVQALKDINLEVRQGEIVGLIGANGAGKSTLYNVVSGFVTPEPGSSLRYRGRELLTMDPSQRTTVGIARTFQHMGLLRPQTVEDNVLLAQHWLAGYDEFGGVLRLGSTTRTEAQLRDRAEKALQIFGLEHLREQTLGSLSYGTMRMVELASAVASGSDLLFFDEASAGLGPDEAHALGDRFHALRDELGLSLVVIEHHVPLIARTCDYVYCLASGRQLAEGEPASVQSNPEVVAEFLGRSTIGAEGATAPAGVGATEEVTT